MFSGGYDSTIAAIRLAETYERVHLVTYRSYGITRVRRCERHVDELRRAFGAERFPHTYLDLHDLHRAILSGFFADYERYCKGSAPGIVCMGCKLSMHTRTIAFCLEQGISDVADGALRTQSDHPEMMPEVINTLRAFYAEHGIRYFSPIYDLELDVHAKRAYLRARAFSVGLRLGRSSKSVQPVCLVGPLATVWSFSEPVREPDMVAYVVDKLPVARRLLEPWCERHAAVVDPAVQSGAIERLEHRAVIAEPEFGPRFDRGLSRAFSWLWKVLRWIFTGFGRP